MYQWVQYIVIINARVCSMYLCGMYLGIRSLCSEWVGGRESGHSWVYMKTPMLHEREREMITFIIHTHIIQYSIYSHSYSHTQTHTHTHTHTTYHERELFLPVDDIRSGRSLGVTVGGRTYVGHVQLKHSVEELSPVVCE